MLHFKESCSLIGWKYFGPKLENQNFARYAIDGEISRTLLVFIWDYLEKLMTKFFKKLKKNLFWGLFWAFFAQILAKMNFSGKKGSVSFLIFQLYTIMQKNRKNYQPLPEKKAELTDWQTERQIDRQRDR